VRKASTIALSDIELAHHSPGEEDSDGVICSKPMKLSRTYAACLLISAGISVATSAEAFYVGTWKIVSATPAPWVSSELKPDLAESKTLNGAIVKIEATRIVGPRQVACSKPHYQVKNYGVDMLFQGSFAEMKERDKSVDMAKAAASAGFRNGTEWKTLETGCETEVDFHFIDPTTAAFGLNNVVYTLKKQ